MAEVVAWICRALAIVGAGMEMGGGADRMCSEDRRVGGAHGVGSTVGPGLGGGVELEEARLGPLSKASSFAMLVAIWLTVPSSAAMQAWSLVAAEVGEAGGRGAPEDTGGGRCVGRAAEYPGSTPAGVRARAKTGASANPRGGKVARPFAHTYAEVAAKARSSSVGCSGKYRRCMMLASRWRRIYRICRNLAGAVDVESAHWMRKGRRSASARMSCRPPSCLITRPGNMSVLPKWLRRGTPTIPGHPVIMGPPGFHRATHKKRASVNSCQKTPPFRETVLGRCHRAEKCPIGEPRDPDALIPPLMKLLVDVLSRYVEESGELTLDGCERIRHEDAVGRGRRPLDECRVLLDRRG
ncbi:hypothetical protein CRG98_032754 [Punica granatum]|uniref:Uncharacterized protein n=1 Tax=Punica granatum TaxID=22663 RepID=A0A2I0IS79_PUNGR|nr:hypothetical protein CRG98_032754 [Punica granatum]